MASLSSASQHLLGASLASSQTHLTGSGQSKRYGNMFAFVEKKAERVRARRDNVGKSPEGAITALFATSEHRKKHRGHLRSAYLKVDVSALREECKTELRAYFSNSKSTVKNQDRVKLIKIFSGHEDVFDRKVFTQSIRAGGGPAPVEEGLPAPGAVAESRTRTLVESAAQGDLGVTTISADGSRAAYRFARENVLREGSAQPSGTCWRRQSFESAQLAVGSFYEELTPLSAAMQEGVVRDLIPVLLKHVFSSGSSSRDGCVAGDVSIVDEEVVAINLKNYSMGDDRMACLNAALAVCPTVRSLDVSGNRLSDAGLRALLLCMQEHLRCEALLAADNCVGEGAARALVECLRDADCQLKNLSLAKCKVSDKTCAAVAAGLAENTSVRALDLSDNKVGCVDESGAAALAICLQQNCCLERLDLSGNNIRRGGASALCEAIGGSSHLLAVNLGSNNIGDEYAALLARRLRDGASALQRLDLSHNGLTYRSAVVLSCMLDTSASLEEVSVDGNNIGSLGGRLLLRAMHAAARRQRPLRVRMSDCGLRTSCAGAPSLDVPSGPLLLNLEDPYEHALATTYLHLANVRAAATLTDIKIRPDNTSRSATFEALSLERKQQHDPWGAALALINSLVDAAATAAFGNSQKKPSVDTVQLHEQLLQLGAHMGLHFTEVFARKLVSTFRKVGTSSRNRPFKVFRLVFKTAFLLVDVGRRKDLDAQQLAACLSLLGYRGAALDVQEHLRHAKAMLRSLGAEGAIERIEQSAFLRVMLLQCCCFGQSVPPPLLDPTGSRWRVPSTGTLKFEFVIEAALPTTAEMSTDRSFDRFCEAAAGALRSDQDRSDIMHLCCSSGDLVLSSAQAEMLLRSFRDASEPLCDSVERLLPLLASPAEACAFLASTLPLKDLLLLRRRAGSYFRVASGVGCSGHYSLDLSKRRDRLTYDRLVRINHCERRHAVAEPRNTSQKCDFDNFRNERVGGKFVKLGRPLPPSTLPPKLAFDYASTARPLQGMPPLAEQAFSELVELVFGTGGAELLFPRNPAGRLPQGSLPAIARPSPLHAGSGSKLIKATAYDTDCLFWLSSLRSNHERCIQNQQLALLAAAEQLLPGRFDRVRSADDYATFYTELMAQQEFADVSRRPLYGYDDVVRGAAESRRLQRLESLLADAPCEASTPPQGDGMARIDLDHSGAVSGEETAAAICGQLGDLQRAPAAAGHGDAYALPLEERGGAAEGRSISAKVAACVRFSSCLAHLEVALVYGVWLSAAQAAQLALLLVERLAPDEVVAHAVCIVFNRIVDLDNFSTVLGVVSAGTRALLYHRLGVNNILSFSNVDGDYEFDLAYADHRSAAQALLKLAAAEGRESLRDAAYQQSRLQPASAPAARPWAVPSKWFDSDRALPKFGLLCFGYVSGETRSADKRTELTKLYSLAGTDALTLYLHLTLDQPTSSLTILLLASTAGSGGAPLFYL